MVQQLGLPVEQALRAVFAHTRDRCRSPMQWSDGPNAGFCPPDVTPWLPTHPNASAGVHVAAQADDPGSLLSFYRHMLHLRRATPALLAGDYRELLPHSENYLAFVRHDANSGQACLVALNFSHEPQELALEDSDLPASMLFSSHSRENQTLAGAGFTLAPFEIIVALTPSPPLPRTGEGAGGEGRANTMAIQEGANS
jgi:glycosidase